MMVHSSSRRIAVSSVLLGIIAALIVAVVCFMSLFYLTTASSLIFRGVVYADWYIHASDFHASIVLQTIIAAANVFLCLGWYVLALRAWRGVPSAGVRVALLLVLVGFLLLMGMHRWFETIICDKGSIPSECTL